MELPSDNDGWILYDYFSGGKFNLPSGSSYAFIGLDFSAGGGKKLSAIRNELRPLWKYESENHTIIASTKDILNRAGLNNCISSLKKNRIYGW
jgi:hypothetical protein